MRNAREKAGYCSPAVFENRSDGNLDTESTMKAMVDITSVKKQETEGHAVQPRMVCLVIHESSPR